MDRPGSPPPSRRSVVRGFLVGTALAAAGASRAAVPQADGAAPWWLLAPLGPGDLLAGGWRVGALSAVRRGAAVLSLEHAEHDAVEVHLCAREGRARGVASTELVDLILMDGGCGDKQTDPALDAALGALADRVRANEVGTSADLDALSRLLPHGDRVARYGPEDL